MKIDKNIEEITKSYLRFQTPEENRSNIITFFLIFLYFIGLFPLIGDPVSKGYLLFAIIPVIPITLWGLLYIVNPYKYEKSYYLFFGIYGLVNTYVFFISIQKMLYVNMNATGNLIFILGIVLFLVLIIGMNLLNIKAIYSGTYHKLQQKKGFSFNWIAIGGIGYAVGQLLLAFNYTDSMVEVIIILCISFLSVITAHFSTQIHKYFFIKKHFEEVKQLNPQFGLPKNERYTKKKRKKGKK